MLRLQRDEKQAASPTTNSSTESPTPTEVARALTALEEQRTRTRSDAALKTTLEEMGSEVTDEEVRAEVARQREAVKAEQEAKLATTQQKRRHRNRVTTITLSVVLALMLYVGFGYNEARLTRERQAIEAEQKATMERLRQAPLLKSSPLTMGIAPDSLVGVKTAGGYELKTLSEIPDGQMVEVPRRTVEFDGLKNSASEVLTSLKDGDVWRVIKYGGQPYLRAYLPAPLSAGVIQKGNIWLVNIAAPGYVYSEDKIRWVGEKNVVNEIVYFEMDKPVPVTLPLKGLKYDSDTGEEAVEGTISLSAVNVITPLETDSHLFEKWEDPRPALKSSPQK